MAVSVPTPSQLREVATEVGLDLTDADVTWFIELMRPSVAAYNIVDAMPDNLPAVRYPRTPGYRSVGGENPTMPGKLRPRSKARPRAN